MQLVIKPLMHKPRLQRQLRMLDSLGATPLGNAFVKANPRPIASVTSAGRPAGPTSAVQLATS